MTKSKGIRVPRGVRAAWAATQAGKHTCQCGCGGVIPIRTDHYPNAPAFLHGHNTRVVNPAMAPGGGRAAWCRREQGKHICACGCGEPIQIKPAHYSEGIPTYVMNHHPHPQRLISQPCACGCGELTTRGRTYVHGHNTRPTADTVRERFLANTDPTAVGCWPWNGRFNDKGYAVMKVPGPRNKRAARVAFELFRGTIPPDLEVDHTCRMRGCVNPWHLDAVTRAENERRKSLTAAEHRALGPPRPD